MKRRARVPSTHTELPEVTHDGRTKPTAPPEEKPQNQEVG